MGEDNLKTRIVHVSIKTFIFKFVFQLHYLLLLLLLLLLFSADTSTSTTVIESSGKTISTGGVTHSYQVTSRFHSNPVYFSLF